MFYPKLVLIVMVFAMAQFRLQVHAKQPHRKVLILGAGLSGIVAGKTLLDNRIDDFLVLEGQDYIGGRIKQAEIAGYKIECGANWIHFYKEEDTAPMWKAKLKSNLKGIISNFEDFIIRDENGKDVTTMVAYKKLHKILRDVESVSAKRKKAKKPPISARVGLALMGWTPKTPAENALEYMDVDLEYGKIAELVPFKSLFEVGADFFVHDKRGMWSIYKDLFKDFQEKIKLNTTVKKIKYNSSMVEVTTSDGEVYTADYALCTFSTGVLGSDMVKFTPPLPEWKREAILTMPMSVYTKIFLKFPRKFWDDKEYILFAGRSRQNLAVFQDLERPGLYPNNSGLLLVTVTGEEGRRVEQQTFEETKAEMVKMLKGAYGQNISEPTDIYYERWVPNKFVQGSYSEGNVGVTSKTFENLAKHLENLYFSGEATSEDWYGYMQGAYITGEQQAKSIIKSMKCRKTPYDQSCWKVSGADQFGPFSLVLLVNVLFYFF